MISRKPTHPGVVLLEDVIKPLGLTITDAARMLGVSRKALSEFVNEKAMLSPDMAIRIAKATNTSPESWMNMQQKSIFQRMLSHFHPYGLKKLLRYRCKNGSIILMEPPIEPTDAKILSFPYPSPLNQNVRSATGISVTGLICFIFTIRKVSSVIV